MKATLDYPPIWLLAFFALVWGLAQLTGAQAPGPVLRLIGWGFIGGGAGLMLWALWVMRRARTTIVPHLNPDQIVTNGPFRYSRNPIYLGDVFTLVGFCLLCGTWIGLALVPIFMALIQKRFIVHEEKKLRHGFGETFEAWSNETRRWL